MSFHCDFLSQHLHDHIRVIVLSDHDGVLKHGQKLRRDRALSSECLHDHNISHGRALIPEATSATSYSVPYCSNKRPRSPSSFGVCIVSMVAILAGENTRYDVRDRG